MLHRIRPHLSWLLVVLVWAVTVAPGKACFHSTPRYDPSTPGPTISRSWLLAPAAAAAAITTALPRPTDAEASTPLAARNWRLLAGAAGAATGDAGKPLAEELMLLNARGEGRRKERDA